MSSRSGQSKDFRNVLAVNDAIAKAQVVIETEHNRLHLGELRHWSKSLAFTGSQNMTIEISVREKMHARIRVVGSSDATVELHEDAFLSATGVRETSYNRNRTSAEAEGDNDYVFDPGATLDVGRQLCVASLDAGEPWESGEWVLSPGDCGLRSYALKLDNGSTAQTMTVTVEYYYDTTG